LAPSATRLHINAISPQTGLLGSSNVGGKFGAWLQAAGYPVIVVSGQASHPIFLDIDGDQVQIKDARGLWGLDTDATHDQLEHLLGDRPIQSLTIGPGGENRVRFACIVSDRDHAAGRTGMGTVMGAKKLKAIVVHQGTRRRRPANTPASRAAVAEYARRMTASADFEIFSTLGGAGYVQWADDNALMSTRNYRQTRFEGAAQTDGIHMKHALVRSRGCARCPVRCKAELRFTQGRLAQKTAFRPEFEPMINLGAKCGLSDIQAIVWLDNLCTRLGIDTTSASTAIAFVMDLAQRNLLPEKWTRGLDLSWGNVETMEALIRQMAAMKGLGAILGLGVRTAAEHFGEATKPYAAQVKGLELCAYHPAALLGSALGYAVSSRGGDYNNVYASLEHRWTPAQAEAAFGTAKALDPKSYAGKGRLVHRAVLVNIAVDSLGICKVPALSLIGTFDLEPEARLTAALTGKPRTAETLLDIAQRTATIERLINLRQGQRTEQDCLPDMFFNETGLRLDRDRFHQMVLEFYRAMGWQDSGEPTPETIADIETRLGGMNALGPGTAAVSQPA
jgi:aldehyde:ferredoxin oxidoreductase